MSEEQICISFLIFTMFVLAIMIYQLSIMIFRIRRRLRAAEKHISQMHENMSFLGESE